jgi:hypothetical protein
LTSRLQSQCASINRSPVASKCAATTSPATGTTRATSAVALNGSATAPHPDKDVQISNRANRRIGSLRSVMQGAILRTLRPGMCPTRSVGRSSSSGSTCRRTRSRCGSGPRDWRASSRRFDSTTRGKRHEPLRRDEVGWQHARRASRCASNGRVVVSPSSPHAHIMADAASCSATRSSPTASPSRRFTTPRNRFQPAPIGLAGDRRDLHST